MLKEIKNRHSIRKYTNKEVTKKDLEKLLKSAMQAPTALNEQPWRFIAVTNKKVLKKMSQTTPHQAMLAKAGAAIVVLGDKRVDHKQFISVDCGAAIQNILLEATHMGLGCCWCAIDPIKERIEAYKELFLLKSYLAPIAVVSIGYPNEVKEFVDRYDEEKVTWY